MTHQACELIRLTDWKQVELCSRLDIRMVLESVTEAFTLEKRRGAFLEDPNGIE